MRRASWVVATLAIASAACGSEGGPTVSAQPASTSSGGSAAVPVGPPQRGDRRAREIKRVSLVDATGKNAEVEAFVSRLLSDAGERELFALSDARLSGASLGMLAAEPRGPAAQRFQASWPSDAYLSLSVADCYIKTTRFVTPDTTPERYRIQRVHIDYDATCPGTMKLADGEDTHVP